MQPIDLAGRRVYVAGHGGLVGGAIVRRLGPELCKVIQAPRSVDLRRQAQVEAFFNFQQPEIVILAAAKVGGILANSEKPAEFAYDNLAIALNVIHAAAETGVRKLVFLGSSCIYPKAAAQPITEDALLSGTLEPTNRAYAVAKIAGIELCQSYRRQHGCDFISVMPPNVYGEQDHFADVRGSHVMAALVRRIVDAKEAGGRSITIWGTGAPRREFLHADDLADAVVFLTKNYSDEAPINVGWGDDVRIDVLARMVADAAEWDGEILTDPTKPDGTMRKVLDVSRMTGLGWRPRIELRDGISRIVQAYKERFHAGCE